MFVRLPSVVLFAMMVLAFSANITFAQKEKTKRKKDKEKQEAAPLIKQAEQPAPEVVRPNAAIIRFEQERYDFGKVAQGDMVKHTFRFTNEGGVDLHITNVSPSCGCTATSWTREPIKPGAPGEIAINFNTAGKMGPQEKTVSITTNSEPALKLLFITGEVVSPGLPLNVQVAPPPVKKD